MSKPSPQVVEDMLITAGYSKEEAVRMVQAGDTKGLILSMAHDYMKVRLHNVALSDVEQRMIDNAIKAAGSLVMRIYPDAPKFKIGG